MKHLIYKLDIGDVFDTYAARWAKISDKECMCIMPKVYFRHFFIGKKESLGCFEFLDIFVLYAKNQENYWTGL